MMTMPDLEARIAQLASEIEGLEGEKRVVKAEQEKVLAETRRKLLGLKEETDRLHFERAGLILELDLLLPRDPNRQDSNINAGGNR